MKKIKITFGRLEVRQILGDYISPTMTIPSPPMYVISKDEPTMEFILKGLNSDVFNVEETEEKLRLPFFKLN